MFAVGEDRVEHGCDTIFVIGFMVWSVVRAPGMHFFISIKGVELAKVMP